jgi:hypothetical protein
MMFNRCFRLAGLCLLSWCVQADATEPLKEDLSTLPMFDDRKESYEDMKDLLRSGGNKRKPTRDDLQDLLLDAKERGDFETHAEAYHRLKVELSTEDEGGTIVIKIKEHGIPMAITAAVVGTLAVGLTNYYHKQKA